MSSTDAWSWVHTGFSVHSIDLPSCIIDPQAIPPPIVPGRLEWCEVTTLARYCFSSPLGDLKRTELRRFLAGAASHGFKFPGPFRAEGELTEVQCRRPVSFFGTTQNSKLPPSLERSLRLVWSTERATTLCTPFALKPVAILLGQC
jgi:hypothetical protein